MTRENGIGETASDRAARREASGVVLRALALEACGSPGAAFVRRRAEREVERLEPSQERRLLTKLLATTPGEARVRSKLLAAYAAELEREGRLAEASAALLLARRLDRESPELVLRAARLARLSGRIGRARRLYARVRALDGSVGHWTRLAAVGEALLSPDPYAALTEAIQAAVRADDDAAAAVGLEERAALRRRIGDEAGAHRDRCSAVFRLARAVNASGRVRAVIPRG